MGRCLTVLICHRFSSFCRSICGWIQTNSRLSRYRPWSPTRQRRETHPCWGRLHTILTDLTSQGWTSWTRSTWPAWTSVDLLGQVLDKLPISKVKWMDRALKSQIHTRHRSHQCKVVSQKRSKDLSIETRLSTQAKIRMITWIISNERIKNETHHFDSLYQIPYLKCIEKYIRRVKEWLRCVTWRKRSPVRGNHRQATDTWLLTALTAPNSHSPTPSSLTQ